MTVQRGLYRHWKGDWYWVLGVGVRDEDGHGNPDAPRLVFYQGTRANRGRDGEELGCVHTEAEFEKWVHADDGTPYPGPAPHPHALVDGGFYAGAGTARRRVVRRFTRGG